VAGDALVRTVLAEQVRDRLLEGILDGSYPPDSRIVETSLARELGTSQAPVREALRGLESLGVVEITPFRGTRVRQLEPDQLLEAYVVRSAIETLGAKLAVPRLSGSDIEELVGLAEKMEEAAKAGDGRKVAEYDVNFHGRIIELSGNRTLLRVWRSLEPFSRTYMTLVMPGSDPEWTAKLHAPIAEALRRKDSRAVVRAIESHFAEVRDVVARRLGEAPIREGSAGEGSAGEGSEQGTASEGDRSRRKRNARSQLPRARD
jgi:DNA-binding GntR family transcriptional regulator